MPDPNHLELLYKGADVENGTVPLDYMVDALVGFAGAYNKVARRDQPDSTHQIRVLGLRPGSTHIILDVLEFTKQNPGAATVISTVAMGSVGGIYKAVKDIAKVINAKKHLAGAPVPQAVFNGPVINIINESGQPFELTKEQYEFLSAHTLDSELDRLTAPLEEGKVDEFALVLDHDALATVGAKDRLYFQHTKISVTSSKDNIWIAGTLNSLSKTGYRGTFHTTDGKHIPYRYVGDDTERLLEAFKYQGVIRALSEVQFDADANPTQIDIHRIEVSQNHLFEN